MSKRYLIMSDVQAPYEDRKVVRAFINFAAEYQPDEIIQIGDFMDFPSTGRWSKGAAAEFEGSVYADCEYAKRTILGPLREAYAGPIKIIEGNHDLRPREYLKKYAPALADSGAFDFDVLLDFDGFGIEKAPDFYSFAPGTVAIHGHLGGLGLAQIAGNTAARGTERFEKSIVMGHTHRLGIVSKTKGYDSIVTSQRFGFEVGNMMDMRKATYLKRATGNWQQGFGIVHVDGKHVRPEAVPIIGGKFVVDGRTYKV